ncbi:MAG: ABC transporter substrate-binding protein [Flavobacteriales bacterium]|nr:ABC transporter substrate-binding protein [Flavobacteriales bacterium]
MKKITIIVLTAFIVFSCKTEQKEEVLNVRLKWQFQTQFAGYIVAKEKGFYQEEGLDVRLEPAGPDLKPYLTVASGSDDIGIGVPNQIITAQSNGVPLISIAQMMQDSPFRFIIKNKNRIDSLQQLKGKDVGIWMGGDEAEFVAMLKSVGMNIDDVNIIPQDFSVAPFLEDKYILSHVSVYNELNLIKANGYADKDSLQIFSPKDYNSAILGDMLFCKKDYFEKNKDKITRFIQASILGWKYAKEHPNEAVDLVLKYNPELDKTHQLAQLNAALDLIFTGNSLTQGIGYIDEKEYQNAENILFNSGQIKEHINIKDTYDLSAWKAVADDVKNVSAPVEAH